MGPIIAARGAFGQPEILAAECGFFGTPGIKITGTALA
jgi:hypothetical protein